MVSVTGIDLGVAPVAATVIKPLKVPAVRLAVFTVAVTMPLPEPVAGLSVSQEALSLAFHVSVPPPVLLIPIDWAPGLLPPCVALNERLVGLAPMDGGTGAADTVKETGIVLGVVPVAATVIVALKVPAARPAVFTLAVTVPLPEPDAGLNVNQDTLSLADQLRVPPPVFAMLTL
jgi:hypothetical protein